MRATWPMDFHSGFARLGQTEVQPLVSGGKVASSRGRVPPLPVHFHFSAETVAVAVRPDEVNAQPVVPVSDALKKHGRTAQNRHDDVHKTIAVKVAESSASAGDRPDARDSDLLEFPADISCQKRRLFITLTRIQAVHIILNVALCRKKVLPSIVVEVLPPNTPAGMVCSERPETGGKTIVGKKSVAIVAIERIDFRREIGYDDVRPAVIIKVAEVNPHARVRLAVFGKRHARLHCSVGERPVTVIVIEEARNRWICIWLTVKREVLAANLVADKVPVKIAGDEKIQHAVLIVIEKAGRS